MSETNASSPEIMPMRGSIGSRLMQESTRIPFVDTSLRQRAKWMIDTVGLVEEMTPEGLVATDEGVIETGPDKETTEGKRVLFIGAGKGHEVEAVLNEFPGVRATALDPHDYFGPPVEKRLKEAGRTVEYLHETVHAGDLAGVPDESVDAATLFFVLHHVDPSEYDSVMSELRRVVKKNGKIFVAEDLVDDDTERAVVEREDRKANVEVFTSSPHNYRGVDEWRTFFDQEGFDMTRVREVKPGKVRHGFFVLVRRIEKTKE